MDKNSPAQPGIIEGFFGRSWTWEARQEYAGFLASTGYGYYIYAPKDDAFLRRRWQDNWPDTTFLQLQQLRHTYHQHHVDFGVGLSPYELYLEPRNQRNSSLIKKVIQLNALQPDILCLLFDDMRGDLPGLAEIQCELVQCAAEHSTAKHIIFCPTYYSFDPVLEKVFGARPEHYWMTVGQNLDPRINIFWTGPKVCSTTYPTEHLRTVTDLLQRKPFLWDNYPVNDGAIKSRILQLRAFSQHHSQLSTEVAGHAVNPMNQAWLSRIPLTTLPQAYRDGAAYNPEQAFVDACHHLCGPDLAQHIIADVELLQDQGLDQFSLTEKPELIKKYAAFSNNPYAAEIVDWLNGGYQFDPACLTE